MSDVLLYLATLIGSAVAVLALCATLALCQAAAKKREEDQWQKLR